MAEGPNEATPQRDTAREAGYIHGRALEVAKAIWGKVPKWELEIAFGCTLRNEDVTLLRARMVAIGTHLVEAARTSPITGCKGSYRAVQRYYSRTSYLMALLRGDGVPIGILRVHETLHGAVAFEMREDPRPGFLMSESQIGNASLLHEEIHSALLWAFGQKFARNSKDFDSALHALYQYYYPQLLGLVKQAARKEGKKVNQAVAAFESLWKQVKENPQPAFLVRARRIFDEEKKGNQKVSMQEFFAMTDKIKPLA